MPRQRARQRKNVNDCYSMGLSACGFGIFAKKPQQRTRHRKNVNDCYSMGSFACGFETFTKNRSSGQGIAKTSTIAILWTHSPAASKLGLRPQTVSPRAAHFASQNDAIVSYILLMPCPSLRFSNAKAFAKRINFTAQKLRISFYPPHS